MSHTHTHAKRVQPAGSLCLARCSRLCCQMNHLQITGVAIAGEKNNTAAPTAWEGEGETKNQLLVEESTQEWDKITHYIKQHLIVDVFSSSSLRKKIYYFSIFSQKHGNEVYLLYWHSKPQLHLKDKIWSILHWCLVTVLVFSKTFKLYPDTHIF